jgi:outer membrane biosynthesis protein TonB
VEFVSQQEQRNKRYGMISSVVMHSVIIMLALLPFFTYPDPPPGQEGILVNLGLPDQGQGEENAPPAESTKEREVQPETKPEPVKEKPVEKPQKTEPAPQKEIIKTEDPDAIALREQKKREQAEKDRQQREEDARQRAETEAKRKAAEEEARKKAEADKLKGEIGGLFGGGKGKGNTGTSGNQGDPNGDPNSKNLEGVSTGKGNVGGGLDARGILARGPGVTDNSQSVGNAVIRVCIDRDGKVITAEFTQKGSSISDGGLKNKAIADAKQWKFGKGDVDSQCGTITYSFKVQ